MHPYDVLQALRKDEADALEPGAICAYLTNAHALTGLPHAPECWHRLPIAEQDAWRMVAKTLAGSTPAYRRGASEAYQDRCEGIPGHRKPGEVPDYIEPADRAEFSRGYESVARHDR